MFTKQRRNPWRKQTALQMLICKTGWWWCRTRLLPTPAINYSYYWLMKQCQFHAPGRHGVLLSHMGTIQRIATNCVAPWGTMGHKNTLWVAFFAFLCKLHKLCAQGTIWPLCTQSRIINGSLHHSQWIHEKWINVCFSIWPTLEHPSADNKKRESGFGIWWTEGKIKKTFQSHLFLMSDRR